VDLKCDKQDFATGRACYFEDLREREYLRRLRDQYGFGDDDGDTTFES
jgi:hypothetical protein